MSSQTLPAEQFTYTKEEGLALFIQAIKGNQFCKEQRKSFNLCRATPLGKYVEPEFCKDKALSFIDCFIGVQVAQIKLLFDQRTQSKDCSEKFDRVLRCATNDGSCDKDLSDYLTCK